MPEAVGGDAGGMFCCNAPAGFTTPRVCHAWEGAGCAVRCAAADSFQCRGAKRGNARGRRFRRLAMWLRLTRGYRFSSGGAR